MRIGREEFERTLDEVDARDGVIDGKVTYVPLACPSCKRVSSSKHWKCLYCGMEFQNPHII